MAFIGSYIAMMPLPTEQPEGLDPVQEFAVASGWDFTKGAAITMGVSPLLAISGTGPRWSTRGPRWGLGSPHAVGAGLRRHSR